MEGNDIYNPLLGDREEEIKRLFNNLKEENQKLQAENDHLKKELEREQILHKNLYKEWKELKSGESNRPKKFKRLVRKKLSKLSYYGILAITILLFAFIFYMAFSRGADKNIISPQMPSASFTDTTFKNKIQKTENKTSIAKPTIRPGQKKTSVYSLKKDNSFM